ncbi:MAG: heat-inducible transcriptional repressor HrcA [Saccharofermentans sp.]|nr:heat-inducible transcriptional repressor HrcA [Saccharofermentans sp.]
MDLDPRKKEVLHAIVDDYVSTFEPVGSKSLIERHGFDVSSATLRNEMADLEHMGFLEKPHTSAGRIPSDKGYREYVDSLMKVEPLSRKEQAKIEENIKASVGELGDLIKSAADTLSQATGFVSLTCSPRLKKSYLTQLKILMIEPGKALVVVVLSAGVVKDKLVRIPNFITDKQIYDISNAIEKNITGKPLDEITLITVSSALKGGSDIPDSLLNQVLYEAYAAIKQADRMDVYLEGSHRMLSLPDFSSMGRATQLLGSLADDGMVAGYLNEMEAQDKSNQDSYMIRIGQEITLEGFDDCSFITTTYNMGDGVQGNIGVIGPKRMEYSKVISQIDFVKKNLDEQIKIINE